MEEMNIMVEETNEEQVQEKQKLTLKQKFAIAGGAALTLIAGFGIGKAYSQGRFSRGLGAMLEADPTLEGHMWEAMGKARAKQLEEKK